MRNWKMISLAIIAVIIAAAFWAVRSGPLSFVSGYFLAPPSPPNGQISLHEPARGLKYFIYQPPGYTGAEDELYPVIYHLHGAMPFPWNIAKGMVRADISALANAMEELVKNGDAIPSIIVAPYDGFGFSMWSNSSSGHVMVEADFVNGLMPKISASMNVATTRDKTSIQGFSMGWFGALKIGLLAHLQISVSPTKVYSKHPQAAENADSIHVEAND